MSLQATAREAHGVIIIDLSGRITLGEGSALLREMIREHLQKGQVRIVLNLSDVNYIDSSGIGELVSGFTTTRSHGGELKLLNLTSKVHDLIQITRLFTVFDIHTDERTAANSFR